MGDFVNQSFEDPGPSPELADGWYFEELCGFQYATFGLGPNLLENPNEFDGTLWGLAGVTSIADVDANPGETDTLADRIHETNTVERHAVIYPVDIDLVEGVYLFQANFKPSSASYAALVLIDDDLSDVFPIVINLANLRVSNAMPAATANVGSVTGRVELLGDDWARVSMVFSVLGPFPAQFAIDMSQTGTSISSAYSGSVGRRFILGGAKLFNVSETQPVEAFEVGWDNDDFEFDLSSSTAAIFDVALTAETKEDFEELWHSNEHFFFVMPTTTAAVFDFEDGDDPESVEDFEEGWSQNELFDFTLGATTAASFDSVPEDFEDFEESWHTNESFDFTMGATTAATFGLASPLAYENFESVRAPVAFTVDPATDTCTAVAHPFSNGEKVSIEITGTLASFPDGLGPTTLFFIVNKSANTFQLSLSSGGSVLDLKTSGTGTNYAISDHANFWTTII